MRRVLKSHGIDHGISSTIRRLSRNGNLMKKPHEIKFGHKIPKSVKEELSLDKDNGNSLWRDDIDKDMTAMDDHE